MPLPAVVFNEPLDLSARLAMHSGVSHCLSALVTGELDAGQQAESLRIIERLSEPCTNMWLEIGCSVQIESYVERPRYNAITVNATDDHKVTPLFRL